MVNIRFNILKKKKTIFIYIITFIGQGKLTKPNGSTYEGRWEEGGFVEGTYTTHTGIVYRGQFRDAVLVEGTKTMNDGSYYEGKFKSMPNSNDNSAVIDGKGTLVYANGTRKYVGQFSSDMKHGTGTLYFLTANNKAYEGKWKYDTMKCPKPFSYEEVLFQDALVNMKQ